jgi:hypothetical protein
MNSYLIRAGTNWKPKYAKSNTSFNKVIAEWRKEYATARRAQNSVRKGRVVNGFSQDLRNWTTEIKAAWFKRTKNQQMMFNKMRQAKSPSSKARIANEYNKGENRVFKLNKNFNSARLAAYKRNTYVNKNEVRRQRNAILAAKAALEVERNKLERNISKLMNNYRQLGQNHNWLYNN